MTFRKGQSGNPNGRPKKLLPDGRSLADLAKSHTEDAVQCLVDVLADGDCPPAARVSAATALLDRGWGRPKQEFEGTVEVIDLSDVVARRRAVVEDEHAATSH